MEYRLRKSCCVNCLTPAVASVDGDHLCVGCLLSMILSSDDVAVIERVESVRPVVERQEID
jgi:hypothetical protein